MLALWAGFWGLVGGSALLLGAGAALWKPAPKRLISGVMALGAGVLIAAVAFDLMDGAFKLGGFDAASLGLVAGALVFFAGDWAIVHAGGHHRKNAHGKQGSGVGLALALGALLDGIPESIAIGASLIGGGHVAWTIVAAVFLSNVPEGLASAQGMRHSGYSKRYIFGVWAAIAALSALSAMVGNVALAHASGNVIAGIQAFAGGAILTMLASTMMPEAYEEGGAFVGLVTALGFLVAFVLDKL